VAWGVEGEDWGVEGAGVGSAAGVDAEAGG